MKHIFLILILLITNIAFSQKVDLSRSIRLTSLNQIKFSLNEIKKNKATAIIFLSTECPICIKMTKSIREMADSFAAKGVIFYIIYPGKYYSNSQINKFQKTYKLSIQAFKDENNELVNILGATITPQVFLVDRTGIIVYSGKIDNWFEDIGKRRTIITEFYLNDAIEAVLRNKSPKIKKTEPVGCIIEKR